MLVAAGNRLDQRLVRRRPDNRQNRLEPPGTVHDHLPMCAYCCASITLSGKRRPSVNQPEVLTYCSRETASWQLTHCRGSILRRRAGDTGRLLWYWERWMSRCEAASYERMVGLQNGFAQLRSLHPAPRPRPSIVPKGKDHRLGPCYPAPTHEEGQMSICLRRREFIAGLGSTAAWPLAAQAQQGGKPPTIGVLGPDASVW